MRAFITSLHVSWPVLPIDRLSFTARLCICIVLAVFHVCGTRRRRADLHESILPMPHLKISNAERSRIRFLQVVGIAHDSIVAALSFYAAYASYYTFGRLHLVSGIHDKALLFMSIAIVSFYAFSLNRGSWRYASIPDLIAIIKASAATTFGFTVALFLLSRGDNLPRSVPLVCFVFMVFGLGAPRLIYRVLKENGYIPGMQFGLRHAKVRNVLLFGVNDNAESFIRAVRRSESPTVRILGFVDGAHRSGTRFQGVKVLGSLGSLESVTEKLMARGREISEIIVTNPNLGKTETGNVVSVATKAGLQVSRIANLSDPASLGSGALKTNPIELSDLLGRPEVRVDMAPVAKLIESKVLLISGAGGSIGSELVRQVAKFRPKRLVITDLSEHFLYTIDAEVRERIPGLQVEAKIADIRDRERLDSLMEKYQPDVVFHAAALKHVPLMENNVLESMKTNILGTRNLADSAVAHGVKTFVMISTDKAINPTSIMGATKRAAEVYCQSLDIQQERTRFKTVRFGNVLGSNGSVVPKFEAQIARGGPVTVTHPDMVRYFMTIPEAVTLVLQASGHGIREADERGKILVLDMGEPVRIVDLARRMIELGGLRPDVDIAIEFTGLRPGEKLYEELLSPAEQAEISMRDGYITASPSIPSALQLRDAVRGIESAITKRDPVSAIGQLKRIVPEYSGGTPSESKIVELPARKQA